ncbi:hypothetical protein GTF97_05125 [Roseobacter sp. HKCCD8767]|nr:hypothetical protein [Rhodobacterales bacterium HKCCD4356]NNV11379.1 hypothetical protein [Roseobacter sp. HKCCD7357]NNV15563.1 hypothetical protein [Roseobacter sp. HKCCD8768]NNV25023.1 hypothetical protein [Roseobacter sp. HKCCD8192]NNV29280.1 hypothetical protein [Roseobacter sp. HKCCD9061]NNV33553.1 hypothetical protein [Roseobacter sp. HKCCD9073]NNV37803.1 hypothetical protein [Roseobacter sp. HKCCD9054]NNV41760.1 hypothetical protein [Roseobacter sp. HKCCD6497]NNV46014.1 hypothetic
MAEAKSRRSSPLRNLEAIRPATGHLGQCGCPGQGQDLRAARHWVDTPALRWSAGYARWLSGQLRNEFRAGCWRQHFRRAGHVHHRLHHRRGSVGMVGHLERYHVHQ